ncbi:TnsA-like heteromeric transposase endonuclease subunit [Micrococcus luteus]|uniref:TnsA-like heteromeric transposase endonuclease subunit n=1 Tax=Micrococcus luteus TaxID=1270 RepID=UPI00214DD7E9|nr:TnsA-like heteromeric transposase endonuclease subunit [Micrococcus luteus]
MAEARPVRRIPSHKGQRHRPGLFWSATTQGHIPYESWLELDRLWIADADPEVSWISGQPMLIRGASGGKMRSHVPDFLLRREDRPLLLVDVKPAEFAAMPKVAEVFA